MAEKSVQDRVKEIIVEQLGVNPDQVTPEAKFIEDFLSATDFQNPVEVSMDTQLEDLPAHALAELPEGVSLAAEYADIGDQLERKIAGISLYASQLDRLFGGKAAMADAVRGFGARTAAFGGRTGSAERYWATTAV